MNTKHIKLILDVASYMILILTIVYFCVVFPNLPDKMAIHYNLLGEVDAIGHKRDLLIPLFSLLVPHFVFWALSWFPQYHNYPFVIKEKNRVAVYEMEKLCVSSMRLLLDVIFSSLVLLAVWGSRLVYGLLIGLIVLLLVTTVGFVLHMRKINNRE